MTDDLQIIIYFDLCRAMFERRLCITEPRQLRLEKVRSTRKPGVTTEGCPIAKWVGDGSDS